MIPLPEPLGMIEKSEDGSYWGYTADQMLAYGAACAAEMRERAAAECAAVGQSYQKAWERASDAKSAACDECADAIRALKEAT